MHKLIKSAKTNPSGQENLRS